MKQRIFIIAVFGAALMIFSCTKKTPASPELTHSEHQSVLAKTFLSIEDSFNSLTQQDLDDFNLTSALWIEAFVDQFGQQWPDHAEFVGFFAGDPNDPEHAPTFFTLRIPEGWQTNGRVIFEQPGGTADHTTIRISIDDFLRSGQAHIMVNTLDLSKIFLSPNSPEDFSKRMNQAVHRIKAFLNSKFADVTYTYATGWSRGGLVLNLACEKQGTPFDGLFAWESVKDWKTFPTFVPYALTNGKTLADDPALERTLSFNALISLSQFLGLALLEIDPDYLAQGGALADYDISTRPQNIQNYWNSEKLATTGKIATKEILFWGLNDELAHSKLGIDYFSQILAKNKQDDVRLYMGKSYQHQLFEQDHINGMQLLQDWVENGIEPGVLTTVLDGDIQHSKAMGFEQNPLQYTLAINNL